MIKIKYWQNIMKNCWPSEIWFLLRQKYVKSAKLLKNLLLFNIKTYLFKVSTPLLLYSTSEWMFASSRRSRWTRALAWATSAFSRSGSYLVLVVEVVEFTKKYIKIKFFQQLVVGMDLESWILWEILASYADKRFMPAG